MSSHAIELACTIDGDDCKWSCRIPTPDSSIYGHGYSARGALRDMAGHPMKWEQEVAIATAIRALTGD